MKSKLIRALAAAMITATLILAGSAGYGLPGGDSVITLSGK
jgi:hypothetical protein